MEFYFVYQNICFNVFRNGLDYIEVHIVNIIKAIYGLDQAMEAIRFFFLL